MPQTRRSGPQAAAGLQFAARVLRGHRFPELGCACKGGLCLPASSRLIPGPTLVLLQRTFREIMFLQELNNHENIIRLAAEGLVHAVECTAAIAMHCI